jgi:hypothetical protein
MAAAALVGTLYVPLLPSAAGSSAEPPAVPDIPCDAGGHPELGMQGRVSNADVASGYAALGYRCNTRLVSQYSNVGGFRVHRYVDAAGHACAFYDSTTTFPTNAVKGDTHTTGVFVLDMSDPAHPVRTAVLSTPAMQSPHESLSLNTTRGLLAADLGNSVSNVAWVDIYDVSGDCRHPQQLSSMPVGGLGHEGAFSPDGKTFWVSAGGPGVLTALDISDPKNPKALWTQTGIPTHGLNLSDDGNTLYAADLGNSSAVSPQTAGLEVLDVTQIQSRVPGAVGKLITHFTWSDVSLPQVPLPITVGGHPYLFEVDEFATKGNTGGVPSAESDTAAHAGAARIIDIANPSSPTVVSNLRLEVDRAVNRGTLANDPGTTSPTQGYASHYCAAPRRADPGIVACSYILSGLRVFDVHDPVHPREIAYFNAPVLNSSGNAAVSAPAFDPVNGQIWYSDANEGFFAVQLTRRALVHWPRS